MYCDKLMRLPQKLIEASGISLTRKELWKKNTSCGSKIFLNTKYNPPNQSYMMTFDVTVIFDLGTTILNFA